jgi:hypothetical protein
MVTLSACHFPNSVELWQSGEHHGSGHDVKLRGGIQSEKQKLGVQLAVQSTPIMTGSPVHDGMKNFSPLKHIDSTKQKRQAVDCLVWKERKALMSKRVDGVDLDGSFGSMLTLAMDMSPGPGGRWWICH